MKHSILACAVLLSVVGCSAPQGKKLADNPAGLAPVATGPSSQSAVLTDASNNEVVSLYKSGTVTLKLKGTQRDGFAWRLAEIPDPTVLKLVSKQYTPGATMHDPGEETWTFQATGTGDVNVKMWYGTLWASPADSARNMDFNASVSDEPQPVQKKSSSRHLAKKPSTTST